MRSGEKLLMESEKNLFKGLISKYTVTVTVTVSHGNVGLDSPARALTLNHAQWKHYFSEVAAHRKMCEILCGIQKWLHPCSRL
jgi:hypothetical protein